MKPTLPRFPAIGVLLLIAAFGLRVVSIANESVDGDEMFSLRAATSTTSHALDLIRRDIVHPPLYYLLLKTTLPNGRPRTALPMDIS